MKAISFLLLAAAIGWFAYQYQTHDRVQPGTIASTQPADAQQNVDSKDTVPETPVATSGSVAEVSTQLIPGVLAQPSDTSTPLAPPPPEVLNAIVTITGAKGAGTGFICNFRGKTFVATNQHVLGVGNPLTVRTSGGGVLIVQAISTALDADVALLQCASMPQGTTSLELMSLPDPSVHKDDPTMIAGNSKGDGVITQTPGILMAIGPQRIEVNNPVFAGNSGSPIVHIPTNKVIGILTEAEIVTLDEFGKASFRSRNSAIKSEIRYFGHRIDSVQQWGSLNWTFFQQTEGLIKQSRDELDCIFAYFCDSPLYKSFKDLHDAHNRAAQIYFDKSYSLADKSAVYGRFLREIDSFAKRATNRVFGRQIYFSQQSSVESIKRMSNAISGATVIAQRDSDLAAILLQKGR